MQATLFIAIVLLHSSTARLISNTHAAPSLHCHPLQSLVRPFPPAVYKLRHFRLHTVPNFDVGGGCDPYFDVRLGDGKEMIFDWKKAVGKVGEGAGALSGVFVRVRLQHCVIL